MAGPLAHGGAWTPVDTDLNNTNGISLGVRFTTSAAKSLGGISFYAPATNTGTYTFALYTTTADDDPADSGTGTLIAEDSIASGSVVAGAWNDLPLPAEITTGVVYTARVHTSSGRFVRTSNVFNAGAVTGNDITLLQAGTDPNPPGLGSMVNGVFLDNAVGYPVSAFGFADYGIDVWEAADVEPIDVAGAIAVGEPAAAGTATVGMRAVGAITVGEPVVSGSVVVAPDVDVTGAVAVGEPALAGAATVANPISVVGAVTVDEPVVAGALTHPVTETPSGFGPLLGMLRRARATRGVVVPTPDCPYDGYVLESARGVRHCPFCGRTY